MRGLMLVLLFSAGPTFAQGQEPRLAPAAILTIDTERLFIASDFGERVAREIEQRGAALTAENRQIEAELARREQELTDQRSSLTPEEFRPLADAFDTRVQETRQAQAAKSRNLNALLEQEREVFLSATGPVLQQLMIEVGATVILERRTVFISANSSDITTIAIERINEILGDGLGARGNTPPD